jgi:hypothetical protein
MKPSHLNQSAERIPARPTAFRARIRLLPSRVHTFRNGRNRGLVLAVPCHGLHQMQRAAPG